jgi:hypothetical protein
MSASSVLNPRKPLLWLGLAAGAAIFFASGALAARAVIDTGDKDGTTSVASTGNPGAGSTGASSSGVSVPRFGPGAQQPAVPASVPSPEKMSGRGAATDGAFYYPGCRAPLPASVLSNGVIDPSKAGFTPNLPSSGFSALQIGLSVYAECDENGAPRPGGELTLDSSWKHDETGIEAYISQRKSEKRVASVLRDDMATFWAGGYVFSVNVNRYHILPYAADEPVRSSVPAPDGDPRASEVLRTLVGQLSGSDDNMKCFWKLEKGDWSNLSSLGIGDPRPQIPAGYTLTDSYITTFTPPAAGCDTSIVPTDGVSMNANWTRGGTSGEYGYIGVSAWAVPDGYVDTWPGSFTQYGANWSNGKFQFGVYAKVEDGLTLDTIRAIAKALDPSFNETCLIQERELSAADLARLGFNTPKGPDGYSIVRSSLLANEIGDGCTKPEGWSPQYNLNWTLERGADTIDVSVSRYGEGGDPAAGYISPNSIWWTDGQGTYYSINAYSRGISPEVSKDDLVAVAKSLDPSFDESKLSQGGMEKPLPAPAADGR